MIYKITFLAALWHCAVAITCDWCKDNTRRVTSRRAGGPPLCVSCVHFHPSTAEWKYTPIEHKTINKATFKVTSKKTTPGMCLDMGDIVFKWRRNTLEYKLQLVVPDTVDVENNFPVHIRFFDESGEECGKIDLINKRLKYGIGHSILVGQRGMKMVTFNDLVSRNSTPAYYWEPKVLSFKCAFREDSWRDAWYYRQLTDVIESSPGWKSLRHLSRCGPLNDDIKRRLLAIPRDGPLKPLRRLLPSSGDESRRRMRRLAALEDRYSREE